MIGTTILGYRVEQLLREDADSTVYRGVNHDLGQSVAIRVLAAEFVRLPDVRERFLQQARAMVAFRHPGIVAVLTADTASAQPAVVAELVEGTTLAGAVQRQGRMSVDAAVDVARKLLEALAYAHARGVLHGELRPANVLVGNDGALKIDGFGALAAGQKRGSREVLVVGNAEYMSPEQVVGQSYDERSDLYSLACIVFELLAGRTPFADANASSTSDFLVRQAHVQSPVPDLCALRADVPRDVDAVLRRALAKRPDERFRNAPAMLDALVDATKPPRPATADVPAPAASPTASPSTASVHAPVEPPALAAADDLPTADDAVELVARSTDDHTKTAATTTAVLAGGVTQAAGRPARSSTAWVVGAVVVAAPVLLGLLGLGVATWRTTSSLEPAVVAAAAEARSDKTVGHRAAIRQLDAAVDDAALGRPLARVAGVLHVDDSLASALALRAYARARLWERDGGAEDAETTASLAEAMDQAASQPLTIAARMIAARLGGDAATAESIARQDGDDVNALPLPVRVELGRALAAQGKVAEMLAVADALKDANDVDALTFAGDAYRRAGDTYHARQALDAALKIEPEHDPARALRALLILEQEDVTNLSVALDDAATLLDLGKDALGNRQRGEAILARALIGQRLRTGAEKEVQRDFDTARQLLQDDPEMPLFEALQAKATAMATPDGSKDWDTPIKLLGDAIKLDPYRSAPYLQLMEIGARARKFDVADKAYADARAVLGENLNLGLARAGRLLAEDKADEALAHLQAMLNTNDVAEVHRDIGKVWMKKGDLQKAVESLKKAAEKASSRSPGVQANVYTWLGRALAKADDHAQAKAAYNQALAATTEFPSTYFWLGLSLAALAEEGGAKEAFQNYLRAEPQGVYAEDAKNRLGFLREGRGATDERAAAAPAPPAPPRKPTEEEIVRNKMAALFGEKGVAAGFGAESGGALEAALGGLDGGAVARGYGTGGMGLRGGGTLGTGRIGTRGRGTADSGYGAGEGGLGAKTERDLTMTQGTPVVLGSLDAEIIRRFVREHASQIRYCYETELTRTPGLLGKIVMKWIINGEGRVMQAQVAETQMKNANVENCLGAKIKTWTFPKPKGGGMVVVNYPFVFKPNG